MPEQLVLQDCYMAMPLGMRTPDAFLKEIKSAGNYRFAVDIDGVMIGPCSSGQGVARSGFTQIDGIIDILLAMINKGKPEWGLEFVGRHTPANAGSLTILLLADCCGQYSERFLETLGNRYPYVIWLAPTILDYCHVASPRSIVYDLTAVGMIRPA